MKERSLGLDLLRIAACFSLFPFHLCEYGMNDGILELNYVDTFIKALFEYHIPIFLMITGALFYSREEIDIKHLYFHNILHILCVYVFWSAIYAVFDVLINLQNVTDVKNLLKWIILDIRDSHYHLWYLPMIIGIYIVIPLFHAAIGNGNNKPLLKYSVVVFLLFGVIIPTLLLFPVPLETYSIMLNKIKVELIAGYFGFTLVGYYLYENMERISHKLVGVLIILSLVSVVIIEYVNMSRVPIEGVNTFFLYFPLPCLIVEITLFILIGSIPSDRVKISRRLIAVIADCMLGVYCMHDLVMSVVSMLLNSVLNNLHVVKLILVVMISFALSVCITVLMKKSRILKRIAV